MEYSSNKTHAQTACCYNHHMDKDSIDHNIVVHRQRPNGWGSYLKLLYSSCKFKISFYCLKVNVVAVERLFGSRKSPNPINFNALVPEIDLVTLSFIVWCVPGAHPPVHDSLTIIFLAEATNYFLCAYYRTCLFQRDALLILGTAIE